MRREPIRPMFKPGLRKGAVAVSRQELETRLETAVRIGTRACLNDWDGEAELYACAFAMRTITYEALLEAL